MKKINLTDYIQKAGDTLRLSETERARMQHVISEYMSVKPIRTELMARKTPIKTAWIELYVFSRKSLAGILAVALLFSGTGISYAAEGSAPGDILYPLKVEVNEPIVTALSVTVEDKASWNALRAERRLEEAERLASENKLTDSVKAELLARFDEHAEEATKDIQKLKDSGSSSAIGIASNFETRLAAHETVLNDFDEDGVVGRDKTREVQSRVRTKALALSKVRGEAEEGEFVSTKLTSPTLAVATSLSLSVETDDRSVESANQEFSSQKSSSQKTSSGESRGIRKEVVEKMKRSAHDAFETVQKTFARVTEKLDVETNVRVTAEIAVQGALLQTADTAFDAGDHPLAFRSYQEEMVSSGKLTVYLKAFSKLKIKNVPQERNSSKRQSRESEPLDDRGGSTNMKTEIEVHSSELHSSIQILPSPNVAQDDDSVHVEDSGGGGSSGKGSGDESRGSDD